ncbi:protein of unknown function UPF0118 [Alkalidesulfovibrio alkalitolerans DSM 16529]|uniref:Permease n=1 Tax=Alkalidesulfovibrio alkalitolerans DSM 16529 TaxID=1121439 RepID=S7T7B6_9BACT|nr:AI-2E family transporter [Alkalidesulfovibrio alkalitolerans]EPR33007.1 protein of unknown function UPF0118 [Alkalidesulfovibrio alkalitolerans DSM 16529]
MILDDKPYTLDRIFRIAVGVVFLVGLVLTLRWFSDVLLPFAIALVLAYLLNPVVRAAQNRLGGRRVPAVLLTLTLVAGILGFLVWLLLPMVVRETAQSAALLAQAAARSDWAEFLARYLPEDIWSEIRRLLLHSDVQQMLRSGRALDAAQAILQRLVPGVWNVVSGATSLLLGFVGLSVIVLYLALLLVDFERVARTWKEYLPGEWRERVAGFLREFENAMARYFRAQALVASIVGVCFATGFWLIGLPFAIVYGLLLGLMNMVPYLQLLGMPPAFFLALVMAAKGDMSVWMALGLVALVFALVQVLQDGFLIPKLVGDATGLAPWLVLLSLSIWGKLLGLLGLIIAIPATCLVLAWYRRYLARLGTPPPSISPE